MGTRVSVFREEHFNAAHRLFNPSWTEEENTRVFGKCSLPNYHGHNYEIIAKVTGEVDPATGYVVDTKWLSDIIKQEVISRFDHRNLNQDVPEFKGINPTAENIAIVIYGLLKPRLAEHLELQIRLYETPRNFVEYPVN
jgi:6-pyruvoyltetrahydropterin/6-carboxytetrahydropterin synthase